MIQPNEAQAQPRLQQAQMAEFRKRVQKSSMTSRRIIWPSGDQRTILARSSEAAKVVDVWDAKQRESAAVRREHESLNRQRG